MDQPQASYSLSMQDHVFDMTSLRGGPESDRKLHPPFQAIIEKGRQAKAQVEQEQYEARKAKRETEIKNAARIRHAEAEANRRRAEQSKMSVDDHKGKLLDEMTKNIKAILEDQYREEIRVKVYEDEDRIASAYEHDIKDQTKARLIRELESVVKAKLGAEFEPEIKQQLAVDLVSVVKAELRAMHETEVKQQLVKDLGPKLETELRAKYESEVKQQLVEQLESGVKAELRAQYEEEIKKEVTIGPKPTILHQQKGTQTYDVESDPPKQHKFLHTADEESFKAIPNDTDNAGSHYPDLSSHQHLINQCELHNDQQETASVQDLESSDTDGDAVTLPRGTKRSLSGTDDEEEDPYARHVKRSRSTSLNSKEQQSPGGIKEGFSKTHSNNAPKEQTYQGVRYDGEENQGFQHYEGDAGYENAQHLRNSVPDHALEEEHDENAHLAADFVRDEGYEMDRTASRYNSFNHGHGSHENILGRGGVPYNSTDDVQRMNGNLLDSEGADDDSAEDVQGTNGNFSYNEEADYDDDGHIQGTDGDFLSREDVDYDSGEDAQGSSGYKLVGEVTEFYSSGEGEDEEEEEEDEGEEEYDEEYESDEEEPNSIAPQAANARNGVISFSNTQDTAVVLSDSENDEDTARDEDKTLVGYDVPAVLIDAKHYSMAIEESLFLES